MTIEKANIVGVVIAGGKATRMGGGEKTLLKLGHQTILNAIVQRLEPQVATIAINSNANPASFADMKQPVFADSDRRFEGPLAGILSAMLWARDNAPGATHIATIAGDSPFFPSDLVQRFSSASPDNNTIVMATSDGFNHPVFALWPIGFATDLEAWLHRTGILKVMAWVKTQPHVYVDFTDESGRDPFFNINTLEDLAAAQKLVNSELS